MFSWAQVRVEYVESVPRENRFVPEFSSHFYIRIAAAAAAAAARFILEPKETEKKERNNEKRRIKAVGSKGFPR